MLFLIAGKLWWKYSNEGEIDEWDKLPLIGKISYWYYIHCLMFLTKCKNEEQLVELLNSIFNIT